MKLAYISIFDPTDIHAWSGTGMYILSALQKSGITTKVIGNLKYTYDVIYKTKEVLYSRLFGKRYHMLWDPILLRQFSIQVEKGLDSSSREILFSIWTNPIAYLKVKNPIIFWGDATFANLLNFHPGYRNLCAETIHNGHRVERLALSKCRLAIYTSEWAANTAINYYKTDPAKVKVVPFGANLGSHHIIGAIQTIISNKAFNKCKLLLVGVDWYWKGADIALTVAELLLKRGINTELHVVGCKSPIELPGYVKLHGFVSRDVLCDLFSQAHFFILPTRADCTPIVISEACSFGLPVLATNIGGITSMVHEGINGFTFPLDTDPDAYCNVIERLWSCRHEYERLVLSSFREYEETMNWSSAGNKVYGLIKEFCH
jgi:glycosyltransferase involved in cell wall biosynthesis